MDQTTAVMSGFVHPDPLEFEGTATNEFYNQLLRGMTHKLNNLLAVIQGFSSLIMMNDDLDTSMKENLDHMKEAAQNASGLSEQILSAGGCVRMSPQGLDLNNYLPMVESNLRQPFADNAVPLHINVAPNVPEIRVDSGRFKEILTALLTNASEAVRASGRGEVALDILGPGQFPEGDGKSVDIFVRNSGSSIPQDKLKEIFQPFFSTKDSAHFGIGLTTACVMANQMHSRIGVKSEDNTVTFWLAVPAM